MSEFDIFFDDYENKHNCSPEKYECFEAGQQSQQGEVNKLQTKISLLEKELTETQDFLNKQNYIKQVKINELQTRMEKLLDYAGTSGHTPNWIIKEFLK